MIATLVLGRKRGLAIRAGRVRFPKGSKPEGFARVLDETLQSGRRLLGARIDII